MQDAASEEDFLRMQQEAIMRVREMQKRARATLESNGLHIENSDKDDAMGNFEEPEVTEAEPTENKTYPHPAMQNNMNITPDFRRSFANIGAAQQQNAAKAQAGSSLLQHKLNGQQTPQHQNQSRNPSNNQQTNHPIISNPMMHQPPPPKPMQNNGHSSGLPQHPAANMNNMNNHQNPINNSFIGSLSKSTQPLLNLLTGLGNDDSNPLSGFNINFDKDQLILLATIYVIFKDGGDKWLMLALAYVLFT